VTTMVVAPPIKTSSRLTGSTACKIGEFRHPTSFERSGSSESEYEHLIHAIDDAAQNSELRDGEDDPPPTARAIELAKNLIGAVPLPSRSTSVLPFDGSIRIIWETPAGNVRMICGDSPEMPSSYVYHERLQGGHASEHGSEPATADSLTKWLNWLRRTSDRSHNRWIRRSRFRRRQPYLRVTHR